MNVVSRGSSAAAADPDTIAGGAPARTSLSWDGAETGGFYTNLLLPLAPRRETLAPPLSGGTDAGQRSGAAAAGLYVPDGGA